MESLRRVHVEGFRSLRQLDLELGRVTVLIGPNGSGKSNLLAFLQMVPMMPTKALGRFVGEAGGASALLHYGQKTTREIALRLEFEREAGVNAYAARLGYVSGTDSLLFLDEQVEFRRSGADIFSTSHLGAGHSESRIEEASAGATDLTARAVRHCLSRLSFFHFHDTSVTSSLRANSRAEDSHYLRSDGSNLAPYLHLLAEESRPEEAAAWRRINLLVRKVAPFIAELQPEGVDPSRRYYRLDWVDDRGQIFGPHHLSDGTLRAIALITALAQPSDRLPAFISIDEPELGLHPAALVLLAELVRSVSQRSQVLLATQSPALLDLFDPEDVVVAERVDGASRLRRLDPAELSNWLEDYTLSQLYDKNLIGGRP